MLSKPVNTHHYNRIASGTKTCEGRPAEKVAEWGVLKGDIMQFVDSEDPDRRLTVRIDDVVNFKDFAAAWTKYGTALVDVHTAENAQSLYYEFPGYESMVAGEGPRGIAGASVLVFTVVKNSDPRFSH